MERIRFTFVTQREIHWSWPHPTCGTSPVQTTDLAWRGEVTRFVAAKRHRGRKSLEFSFVRFSLNRCSGGLAEGLQVVIEFALRDVQFDCKVYYAMHDIRRELR